jgi:hypothetical protein
VQQAQLADDLKRTEYAIMRSILYFSRNRSANERSSGRSGAPDASTASSSAGRNEAATVQADGMSVLQPDVDFTVPPFAQMLHGHAFSICAMLTVSFFGGSVPLRRPGGAGGNEQVWRETLIPLMMYSLISIGFHLYYIYRRESCLQMQLGPAPDGSVTMAAANLQWLLLHESLMKQHLATNFANITLLTGIFCSLCLLTAKLGQGKDISLQLVAMPLVICEFVKLCIHMAYRIRCGLRIFSVSGGCACTEIGQWQHLHRATCTSDQIAWH